ncbi:hypothetical protein BX286_6886 [Streptomyces sp. 3211.6]|uniref:hypothetical protein n=1 Tax=Streptomyces sp. 3211.6 TaxID=1938845 RepID=UPI000F1C8FC2|nr:hypothetical protein [Streptomyces sp. 3211.6]RKS97075.1 hypothetical protein BX286_6886 [Streptomyces sp. 3211.6]
MRVLLARLAGPGTRPDSSIGPVVEDLIWAHARPPEGLEHLTVQTVAEGLELYLFVRSDSESAALDRMVALLGRVRGPLFRYGYTLDHR